MADIPYTFCMYQLLLRIPCEFVTICPRSDLGTLKVTWRNQENGIDRATLLLIFQGRSYSLNGFLNTSLVYWAQTSSVCSNFLWWWKCCESVLSSVKRLFKWGCSAVDVWLVVIMELRCVQLTEFSTADLDSAGLDTGMTQPEEDRLYKGGKLS